MGMTNVAAAMAALLAGVLIALSLATASPGNPKAHRATGSGDLQAGYSVRGQAWATELFGRRYGRHLMAETAQAPNDGDAAA